MAKKPRHARAHNTPGNQDDLNKDAQVNLVKIIELVPLAGAGPDVVAQATEFLTDLVGALSHLRALRWPDGARPERLQGRAWIEAPNGQVLLMAADVLARGLIAPQELPVGVLTAVLGGAYLLWLMHRQGLGRRGAGS